MVYRQKYTNDEIAELLERNYQRLEESRGDFFIYRCRVCHQKDEKHRSHLISYAHSSSPFCKCLRDIGFMPLFITADSHFVQIKCLTCKLEKLHRFTDGIKELICATPGCTEERQLRITKQRFYKDLRLKKADQFGDWLRSINAPKEGNEEYVQTQLRRRVQRKGKVRQQIPLDDENKLLDHYERRCFFCNHEIKKIEKNTFIQLGNEMVPECGFCKKQRKEAEKTERRGKKNE